MLKLLEVLMSRIDLNDAKLIMKCHLLGALIGGISMWLGSRWEYDPPSDDTMAFLAATLLLTLLLPYRIHCQKTEKGPLKIMGTFPGILLGAGWPLLFAGGLHPIWFLVWPLGNVLFGTFWVMSGMSRGQQVGTNAQLDQPSRAIGKICGMLSTPMALSPREGAVPFETYPALADKILRAFTHADSASLLHFLEEAECYLKEARAAAKMPEDGSLDRIFKIARVEVTRMVDRLEAMSNQELEGGGAESALRVKAGHPLHSMR